MTEALKHRVVSECRRQGVSADEADKLFKKRVRMYEGIIISWDNIYYLLIKALVWDFPVMNKQMSLISYLFYGLFIMDLSLQSTIKTNNWPADNFKNWKHITSMSCTLESTIQSGDTGQQIPFWQLSIYRNMDVHKESTIKLNTDCVMSWTPS